MPGKQEQSLSHSNHFGKQVIFASVSFLPFHSVLCSQPKDLPICHSVVSEVTALIMFTKLLPRFQCLLHNLLHPVPTRFLCCLQDKSHQEKDYHKPCCRQEPQGLAVGNSCCTTGHQVPIGLPSLKKNRSLHQGWPQSFDSLI